MTKSALTGGGCETLSGQSASRPVPGKTPAPAGARIIQFPSPPPRPFRLSPVMEAIAHPLPPAPLPSEFVLGMLEVHGCVPFSDGWDALPSDTEPDWSGGNAA